MKGLAYITIILVVVSYCLVNVGVEAKYRYVHPDDPFVDGKSILLELEPGTEGPYGGDIKNVNISVTNYSEDILNIKFMDSDALRWEVPNIIDLVPENLELSSSNLQVEFSSGEFGFSIRRKDQKDVFFEVPPSTEDGSNFFVFEDQYLEITTILTPDPVIYGLGERVAPLRLPYQNQTYTIFSKDLATPEMKNIYGSHPFYMEIRNGKAHGVFLLNSNGMDIVIQKETLTYKVIGGILDFFFFNGPTPQLVVQQYQSIIGKPYFPPYWSLGWHQCRWGYKTIEETEKVVLEYDSAGIPLESIWNDIDYMDGYRDFTMDPVRFAEDKVTDFITRLHKKNQKYVIIVDPGIKVDQGYPAFDDAIKMDIFIKNCKGHYLLGKVWPGLVYFPDFTKPETSDYWLEQFYQFQRKINFDGIWIDMNEVSNFCDGECANVDDGRECSYHMDNPPFKPSNGGEDLNAHTISLSGVQHISSVYNLHNLYAHHESEVTRKVADKIYGKRSLILTRSSFPGTGRYASHWLGDNHSTWEDLKYSISGAITMGVLGVPLVGADICGFIGQATPELCTRWIQLGSFYPFSRNHNNYGETPQEPYAYGKKVSDIAAKTIQIKYELLPYYYTLLFEAHTRGNVVLRGLFYDFFNDTKVLENDSQFMIGSYLMVVPVLNEGKTSVEGYLPSGLWYDYYTGECYDTIQNPGNRTFDAPLSKINLLCRGGGIIPMQFHKMTTYESRKQPFKLLVLLDENGNANGDLYLDDGEGLDVVVDRKYTLIHFIAKSSSLSFISEVVNYTPPTSDLIILTEITVRGIKSTITQLRCCSHLISNSYWNYIQNAETLVITYPFNFITSTSIYLTWK